MQVPTLGELARCSRRSTAALPFPPEAMRVPRGKTAGTQKVALPPGYLDHLDDDTPPGPEAETAAREARKRGEKKNARALGKHWTTLLVLDRVQPLWPSRSPLNSLIARRPPSCADCRGARRRVVRHHRPRRGETTPFALRARSPGGRDGAREGHDPEHARRGAGRSASFPPKVEGETVGLGPFSFRYDAGAGTLSGVVPEGLAPVYRIPLVLRRVERVEAPARPAPDGSLVQPVVDLRGGLAPLGRARRTPTASCTSGGQDGQVHAVEARTGRRLWVFSAGGAVRTRPTVAAGSVYVPADDGFLYKLNASGGEVAWRVRVVEKAIERLPFDNPRSRYDRFGSDVTVKDGRLYLGTHDGNVLAVDAATGARLWTFATGDAVLAAPAVDAGPRLRGELRQARLRPRRGERGAPLEAGHAGRGRLDAGGGRGPAGRGQPGLRRPRPRRGDGRGGVEEVRLVLVDRVVGDACGRGWRTWARPTRPPSSPSTRPRGGASGRPTCWAGPGASRRSPRRGSTAARRARPATRPATGPG